MAVFTLNDAISRALSAATRAPSSTPLWAPTRTAPPVLRGSREAGTFEETFFVVPAKGETDRLLHIARRTLDAGRRLRRDARAGARILTATERVIAALTGAAIRVYEELLTLARLNKGRVFPSYDHLACATGLSRASIARAIPLLERIGFLIRQRRFKRVPGNGTARYSQTSNVYRAMLPGKVLAYLPRWMRPSPLPSDETWHRKTKALDHQTTLASLTCRELAEATVTGPMGRMLAKLGAALDRNCESQNEAQQPSHSLESGESGMNIEPLP